MKKSSLLTFGISTTSILLFSLTAACGGSDDGGDGDGDGDNASAGDGDGSSGDGDSSAGDGDGDGDGPPVEVENPLTDPTSGPPAGNPEGGCDVPAAAGLEDVSTPDTVVGDGTPESCTGDAFIEAVASGGVITFNCGEEPHTITTGEGLQ